MFGSLSLHTAPVGTGRMGAVFQKEAQRSHAGPLPVSESRLSANYSAAASAFAWIASSTSVADLPVAISPIIDLKAPSVAFHAGLVVG